MEHFQTNEVDKVLLLYKGNPCEETLDALYNSIDHIVVTVTSKIATGFSRKFPDDFEDIQQNVRITIYKILPKLASISTTGNQVISIIVKASIWKFKSCYASYKKKTPVKFAYGDPNTWMPEHNVGVEVQLELAMGGMESDHSTGENASGTIVNDFMVPKVWVNSNQFETLYLKTLPDEVINRALAKNRYTDKVSLVRFCLLSLIEGRDASLMLISKKWDESNASWWNKYSTVLLKLAIIDIIK